MYIPAAFNNTNQTELMEFIRGHALATLISENQGKPEANHIPLLIFERDQIFF